MSDLYRSETISTDKETKVNVVNGLGYDGKNLQRQVADALASKTVVSGDVTYVAEAAPGTDQAEAKWRVFKVDKSTPGTTLVTWSNGSPNFENPATDLASLTYS